MDGMATEQAYYGMTAYYRFLQGQTGLYDMSDVSLKKGENVKSDSSSGGDTDNGSAVNAAGSNKGKTAGLSSGSAGSGSSKNEAAGSESSANGPASGTGSGTTGKSVSGKTASSSGKTVSSAEKADKEKETAWSFDGPDYVADRSETVSSLSAVNTPEQKTEGTVSVQTLEKECNFWKTAAVIQGFLLEMIIVAFITVKIMERRGKKGKTEIRKEES